MTVSSKRFSFLFFSLAACGTAASLTGAYAAPQQFYRSYLAAYLFWLGVPLGSLGFLLIHNLTGGRWGEGARPILESASATLGWMILFFLPLLPGLPSLYPWAQPALRSEMHWSTAKAAYLSVPFFTTRSLIYLSCWAGLSYLLARRSKEGPPHKKRAPGLSGAGLLFLVVTLALAAFDWGMSLDLPWYSSVYGTTFTVGQGLTGLAFTAAFSVLSTRRLPAEAASPSYFHDIGNLTWAFVMLWAYLSFSQYLLVWYANIAEEVPYYLRRLTGFWKGFTLSLAFAHFVLPFSLLLFRGIKRRPRALLAVMAALLLARYMETLWLVRPAFIDRSLPHWLDMATLLALGGVWMGIFLGRFRLRTEEAVP